MDAYIQGKRIALNPKDLLGEGGEAKVYLYRGAAIKIYHPSVLNKRRTDKLKAFPSGLPPNLVGPTDLVTDRGGQVIGFSMKAVAGAEPFIMLSNKKFRENFQVESVIKIFLDTLETLKKIHGRNVIVGDLNDLNLLFKGEEAMFIDADSMQFGGFPCEVATEQFLDPRLYGLDFAKKPVFSKESDYYSFAAMLFKSLLLVSPFGGVHKKYPTLTKRAESRITIFDQEVKYPKAAIHFKILPDDLLDYFQKTFEKDQRGEFPKKLLEGLRFTKCTTCGTTHAKNACPECFQAAPAAVKQVAIVNQRCIATNIFKTAGRIITAKFEGGKMRYVYEEGGEVRRENGQQVLATNPDNFTRFAIMGNTTLVGRKKKLLVIKDEQVISETTTGMLGNLPVFESSESEYFRLQSEYLMRGEAKIIGQVLENQTWMKVGPKFGFGFYRIGRKTVHFIFKSEAGINDSLSLPAIEGQLIDAEAVFSENHVLFLISTMENGKLFNAMYLLDAKGNLLGSAKEEAVNSKILSIIHNKVLGGDKILTATDDGLMLLENNNGNIQEVKLFRDTEPFVDQECQIFTSGEGIYVVSNKEIKLLKLV